MVRGRLRRLQLIERQIQPQDIDPRLADEPEKRRFDRELDKLPHPGRVEAARLGHRRDLRERNMSKQTRLTVVVSQAPRFSTALASVRLRRSQAS